MLWPLFVTISVLSDKNDSRNLPKTKNPSKDVGSIDFNIFPSWLIDLDIIER